MDGEIYVIEVNPRASRTVPYISKVTGVPMCDLATKVSLGYKLRDLGFGTGLYKPSPYVAVKVPVFSFEKLADVDTHLGPEMKSTGEVMGIARNFPAAFAKTQLAISYELPEGGTVFVSVCDRDKRSIVSIARDIERLGFKIVATAGTARTLAAAGIEVEEVRKVREPSPNIRDMVVGGQVAMLVNTPFGNATRDDGYELRTEAVKHGITQVTNLAGAQAMVAGMEAARARKLPVVALQDLPQWQPAL